VAIAARDRRPGRVRGDVALGIGLVVAAVGGLWPVLFSETQDFIRRELAAELPMADSVLGALLYVVVNPVTTGFFQGLAEWGGTGAFWTCVLVFLPAAVCGHILYHDRGSSRRPLP
jgi:hypothetical protein